MMSVSEEPILPRINRLHAILKQLEDIRGDHHSPKSSYESTTSSGTLTSDGHPPWSPEIRCRPVNEVMLEVQEKGNLLDRLLHAEDRILKVCMEMEEELESERSTHSSSAEKMKSPKKGLKQFVKSCVKHHKPTTS